MKLNSVVQKDVLSHTGQCVLLLCFAVVFSLPSISFARHNDGGDLPTSSLGSKTVSKIPVPILFGLEYESIRSDFGDPRDGGSRSHEGQDMFAIKGAPIVSPTKAVVSSVGTGESAGKFVYTSNPGGETFRYMHLDSIANIKRGTKLSAGDFIGTVGDTGNAKGITPHLHFEIRKDREATDPYPRMTDTFSFKEKISFLETILDTVDDESEYVTFLVKNYKTELQQALNLEYDLPSKIIKELKKEGVVSKVDLQKQLDTLILSIPKLLKSDIKLESQGTEVVLLQLFLSYHATGQARTDLFAAGMTGYFGPVTERALRSYQLEQGLPVNGIFDAAMRTHTHKD